MQKLFQHLFLGIVKRVQFSVLITWGRQLSRTLSMPHEFSFSCSKRVRFSRIKSFHSTLKCLGRFSLISLCKLIINTPYSIPTWPNSFSTVQQTFETWDKVFLKVQIDSMNRPEIESKSRRLVHGTWTLLFSQCHSWLISFTSIDWIFNDKILLC